MARSLALYLDYNLAMLGLDTVAALSPGEIVHRARHVSNKDVVFAISYGRGLRQTVEGLKQASENGAFCVAMSDTFLSPLTRLADQFFLTSAEHVSFADSYVAGMSLLGSSAYSVRKCAPSTECLSTEKSRSGTAHGLSLVCGRFLIRAACDVLCFYPSIG